MKYRRRNLIVGCMAIGISIMISCEDTKKPSRQELMEVELNQRINTFKNKKQRECRKDFMSKIEYEVDSMMYFLVEKMKGKSDEIPPRPNRPDRLVDTIELYSKDSISRIQLDRKPD